eukprot:9723814-Alexandrium_andersonii.AAC.1
MPSPSGLAAPNSDLSDLGERVRSGAPRPVTSRGVFPEVDEEAPATLNENAAVSPEGWTNYRSAESDLKARAGILGEMVRQGWAGRCEDLDSLRAVLG